MMATASIGPLPDALRDEGELNRRFAGRRPIIFLAYDSTLTPTCVVAARAGRELEFYFGQRLLLVDVCHHLTQGHNFADSCPTPLHPDQSAQTLRVELMAPSEATPVFELPNDVPWPRWRAGIDPIRWSRPKVADLKASSDIAGRGLTCRTFVGRSALRR